MNARQHEHGERCENRTEEGAARHTERDRRCADQDGERRPDGRTRGNAEDERLGERILNTRLHDNPRERETRPCRHRQ